MSTKTQTKIKNILLTILGFVSALVMASEVQNPDYWWIQALAAIMLYGVVSIAVGGKRDGKIS
jgi:MFS superfamily sulfate permease-like transporter